MTIHPLTVEDAEALARLPGIRRLTPVVLGAAPVENGGRTRNIFVYGVTSDAPEVWRMPVRAGRFLPELDPGRGAPLVVLGPKLKRELFGEENCLGQHVRVSGQRFFVLGVMEPKGQFLGFDLDDSAYIPVAEAQRLFNRVALQEIDVLIENPSVIDPVVGRIKETIRERHKGDEDFTVTTQTGMLESLDKIIRMISLAVGGIGAISLLVGAIGILTIMWISVNERTAEIGLVRAIGATSTQVLWLFLGEAALLSTLGGFLGLALGVGVAQALRIYVPALPVHTPPGFALLAMAVSFGVGVASGLLPARRAAGLDPVAALAAE
jgi:putative ABC transport system permease protein